MDQAEEATRRIGPEHRPRVPAGDGSRSGSQRLRTLATPTRVIRPRVGADDALLRDEMSRLAITARLMLALNVLGFGLVPLLHVDRTVWLAFIAIMVANTVSCGLLLHATSDISRYTDARVGIATQVLCLCIWGLDYIFGPFSAAPITTVMPLVAYALSSTRKWSFAAYLHCAIGHLMMGLALGQGWIPDHAVIPSHAISLSNQLIAHACIQTVLLFSFLLGRWSRAKTVATLTDLESAVRQVAERDALLAELHHHLDVAAGLRAAGRFTDHVIGPYRLGPLIGRGAMGEVYEAAHAQTGAPAAIKMLGRGMVGSRDKIARFLRELEIARKLDAPNVVQVLEIGDPGDDLPYLAMERLRGEDLADILRQRRVMPPAEVVAMVEQVAAGLDEAHRAGIVHRDLKPSNLFWHDERIWKVLDFGVSKLNDSDELTNNAVIGTPAFMAPEQARGETVDGRADVYALAAIAYRAMTGVPLFSTTEVSALLYMVVHRMPPRPSSRATLHGDVDAALAIGLAKDPTDRFATAHQLAAALAAAVRGELPDELRAHARTLLAVHPWGALRRRNPTRR